MAVFGIFQSFINCWFFLIFVCFQIKSYSDVFLLLFLQQFSGGKWSSVVCFVWERIKLSELWCKGDHGHQGCVSGLTLSRLLRLPEANHQSNRDFQTHNSWISLPTPFHVPVDAIVWTAVFIDCLDWFFWDLWVDRIELWMRQYLSWPWATNAQRSYGLLSRSRVTQIRTSSQSYRHLRV